MPKSSLHGCTTRNGNVARAYSVHPLPLTYRLSALRAGLSTVAYSRGSEHTARVRAKSQNMRVLCVSRSRYPHVQMEMQREIWRFRNVALSHTTTPPLTL